MSTPAKFNPAINPPTAMIVVSVYPIGRPGHIGLTLHSTGPANLNAEEIKKVLTSVIESLDEGTLEVQQLAIPPI